MTTINANTMRVSLIGLLIKTGTQATAAKVPAVVRLAQQL
jgi:hypothetical protein